MAVVGRGVIPNRKNNPMRPKKSGQTLQKLPSLKRGESAKFKTLERESPMPLRKQKLTPPKERPKADQKVPLPPPTEVNQRPHEEFARDFTVKEPSEADRTFAFYWEEALAMESELELEMEREFQAAESEPWMAQLLAMSWGACPFDPMDAGAGRFRISKDMIEAMNVQDPFEAMHIGQGLALYMHFNNAMRSASRTKDVKTRTMYYELALKLSSAHTKTQESLARLRNKGQQKIVVEKVLVDNGRQRSEGHRVTVSGNNVEDRLMHTEPPMSFSAGASERPQTVDIPIETNIEKQTRR